MWEGGGLLSGVACLCLLKYLLSRVAWHIVRGVGVEYKDICFSTFLDSFSLVYISRLLTLVDYSLFEGDRVMMGKSGYVMEVLRVMSLGSLGAGVKLVAQ